MSSEAEKGWKCGIYICKRNQLTAAFREGQIGDAVAVADAVDTDGLKLGGSVSVGCREYVGDADGFELGSSVGDADGIKIGTSVGDGDSVGDGFSVGDADGLVLGGSVASSEICSTRKDSVTAKP